jgi:hypothetical protein
MESVDSEPGPMNAAVGDTQDESVLVASARDEEEERRTPLRIHIHETQGPLISLLYSRSSREMQAVEYAGVGRRADRTHSVIRPFADGEV